MGIIFDHKLTFNQHIAYVQKRCHQAVNIVKFLCGTWWGAHPDTLLTLYKSYVRSIIDYGLFVWFPTHKKAIQKIERIQYSALRAALGMRKSTPVNVLIAESKLNFIRDRAQYLCKRYLTKILSNRESPIYKTMIRYYNICIRRKRKRKRIIRQSVKVLFHCSSKKNTIFHIFFLRNDEL